MVAIMKSGSSGKKEGKGRVHMFIKELVPLSRGHVARALCGSAMGLVAAFALASCSGPASQDQDAAFDAMQAIIAGEPESEGSPARLRLISAEQYINTLGHVFGPDIDLGSKFPPLQRTNGLLANGAAIAGVTAGQLEQYQRTAAGVASQVVDAEHRYFLIPCKPASDEAADNECTAKFLGRVGRLMYRRPLGDVQLDAAVEKAGDAADRLEDFYAGIAIALEGMMIGPEMLFIVETSEPDPDRPGQQRLDAYSVASRLSFFLWNAAPDNALLDAAESGEILTAKGRARVVDMMLASPRLEAGMRAFFDDMYAFDDFDSLAKDPLVYPSFTGVTVADAREQTLRTVVDHLITKHQDYRDLYTTRSTFLSPALAAIYQLPAPPGWSGHEFPEGSPRAGLLTQISFLAVHSHPGRSSPTLRGKALRELLLCQPVPRPPPDVDFTLVQNPSSSYPTQRDRVSAHLENPVCAGCHKITDPMGLSLENFDGSGRYRASETGTLIDASGTLDGKEFGDVIGLAQALRDHPALPSCLVERVFSYGSGGAASPGDRALLGYFATHFATQGYKLPELLRMITLSKAFSKVVEKQDPSAPPAETASVLPLQYAAEPLN